MKTPTRGGYASLQALLLAGAIGALSALAVQVLDITVGGNFHTVVDGEVYRSAQPNGTDLAREVAAEGIRSVINLRGDNLGTPWYDAEIAEAKRLGVTHIDFRMSSRHQLSQAEAAALIEVMRTAPKPVLIHCAGGSDRSGLAAALYIAAIAQLGEDAAEEQLSLAYGHISLEQNPAFAMDRTFEALEPWLGFVDS